MPRILGIDPGTLFTGFGIVDRSGQQVAHVAHGTIILQKSTAKPIAIERRLQLLYEGLDNVINQYKPHIVAVEKAFFAKSATSALKLGQARGVILLIAAQRGLKVFEYNPTEVKKALVGAGRADKKRVAQVVQLFVGPQEFETEDASDGLAIALCHAHQTVWNPSQHYEGKLRKANETARPISSRKTRSLAESLSHKIPKI